MATLDRDFGDAGLDGVDMGGRALLAVLPLGALGEDRLHAAVGKFGLARQCLRFGADLRGHAAMAFDVAADRGETDLGVFARRQFGDRGGSVFMRSLRLGTVGGEAAMRFDERGFARGMTVDFAFGAGVALARGIELALRGAPSLARGAFGAGRHLQLAFGVLQRLTLDLRVDAGLLQLVLEIDETGALG